MPTRKIYALNQISWSNCMKSRRLAMLAQDDVHIPQLSVIKWISAVEKNGFTQVREKNVAYLITSYYL